MFNRIRIFGWLIAAALLTAACDQDSATDKASNTTPASADETSTGAEASTDGSAPHPVAYSEEREPCTDHTPLRKALFGDLHVHTSFSFDAAANSLGTTPVDANAFAQGEAIPFFPLDDAGRPAGQIRIDRPLDFLAVTDHGEFLGERALCRSPDSPRYDSEFCRGTRVSERDGMRMLGSVITAEGKPQRIASLCGEDGNLCREWAKEPWARMVEAAEAAYDRSENCTFTSFAAYEYTGTPGTSNYHRNVIFRNGNVPELPVSYIEAPIDNLLWEALDGSCTTGAGCDYLTIPHNTNLANGRMGPYKGIDPTLANRRAYAETRQQREPIMEIFQHKGGSECINGLSSVLGEPDELCNVEAVRTMGQEEVYATQRLQGDELVMGEAREVTRECEEGATGSNGMLGAGCVDATDYQRSALLVGLEEARETGVNPIKLGIIAATDTHASTPGAVSESDWGGHVSLESTPAERLQPGLLTSGIEGNPGGLAGVWAVENSRDAIFDAMLRREVFGTSGPRITPRFFAGWEYADDLCERADMVAVGYDQGVPMGGDLSTPPPDGKPNFIAYAARDPAAGAAPLQQLQLIKGWIDGKGQRRTQVIPIAGNAANGAGVDLATGRRTGEGFNTLCTVYRDESFDPAQSAYYYLRVVENPSARWSYYDCQRLPEPERPAVCSDGSFPSIIQEMAWTSPIWYEAQSKDS